MTPPTATTIAPPLVVLFDGTCGLCNSLVNFILKRDGQRRFRFAPLQSDLRRDLLVQHQLDPNQSDTVVLIDGDHAYLRSSAVLRIAIELPDPWPLAGVLSFVPPIFRDQAYDFVASHRHQWFKSAPTCRVPTEQEKDQFL